MKEIPDELKRRLKKQQYEFAGKHTAVKICDWTKKSLRDEDFCYKEKFYGIKSHLCCQMSPTINYCSHSCVFCWRPTEYNLGTELKLEDEPEELIENCIKAQKKQLTGFGGNTKVNMKKFKEAQNPMMFAISLSGEPTLYPKLGELINGLHKRKILNFLVTNGTYPESLEKLIGVAEPTQLYITLPAPNEEVFQKTCKPQIKYAWKKIMESLCLLSKFKCRRVIRLTLVKGLNMVNPEGYVDIIKKTDFDFVEVKGYVWVGFSRQRLKEENMPTHYDIMQFAKKICEHSGLKIVDEKIESRVALLMKEDMPDRLLT
jgi:tRNA wybutosine-synthesizing protein 1